ncbi:MAG: adenosylmethionine--8-amino-7-oxononanoate transaminase [Desulfobulbaceae bacterium]|uniref:Adenosylmethionine-8-amino-7-oxononanoate aminotransferase n=1 Tax=Candidatus Desulfatifera sulfidica TaxID=2841691 RepID=A0A8J6N8X5_9BACT|nr:adenosylmethionine--8-amino-7-oxononanoate transaminase [Candidatus Desulfatifera sulfidica]
MSSLLDFDRNHLWHPYTSMTEPLPVYEVTAAHGVRLQLADGRELIDGMSSWWAAIHGYNHSALNRAATEQLGRMSHVMFGGLTHEPAVSLARKLVEMSPAGLERVFFCDSGSVSVEVAIKMALQYWQARGKETKNRLLTIRGGYHGDTFGAMAVCDPVGGMHQLFQGVLPRHLFAPLVDCRFSDPWDPHALSEFAQLIRDNHQQLAAVILEPIVQGAGGMRFYHPRFLAGVRRLCDEFHVLLIADEIATGFGRTGKLFACEHAEISPDIMCVGKALTGGYLSLAATLATAHIAETISGGDPGLFMHGPTFMANPLACAIANASLQLLLDSPWQQQIQAIEAIMDEELTPLRKQPGVSDVRVLGGIGVVEMKKEVDVASLQQDFISQGVWIRPFGRLVYIMPPYIINSDDLRHLTRAMVTVLEKNQSQLACNSAHKSP